MSCLTQHSLICPAILLLLTVTCEIVSMARGNRLVVPSFSDAVTGVENIEATRISNANGSGETEKSLATREVLCVFLFSLAQNPRPTGDHSAQKIIFKNVFVF